MGKPVSKRFVIEFVGMPSIGKTTVGNEFERICKLKGISCKNIFDNNHNDRFLSKCIRLLFGVAELFSCWKELIYVHNIHIKTVAPKEVFSWDLYFLNLHRYYRKKSDVHFSILSQGYVQYTISLYIRNDQLNYIKLFDKLKCDASGRIIVYLKGDPSTAYNRMLNRSGYSYIEKDATTDPIIELRKVDHICNTLLQILYENVIELDSDNNPTKNANILLKAISEREVMHS